MTTIDIITTLAQMNCGVCGGVYAINEAYRARASAKGTSWTCPYCKCGWGYSHSGTEAKLAADRAAAAALLNKQVAEAQERTRQAVHARDQAEALAAKALGQAKRSAVELKRTQTRIHNGVCPCCNRTFVKLGMHMARQHPEYSK